MQIKPLREDLEENIARHSLKRKWDKAKDFFEVNFNYPSLKTEILEPRWRGIYSFRLDKKYRALFLSGMVRLKYFPLRIIIKNNILVEVDANAGVVCMI